MRTLTTWLSIATLCIAVTACGSDNGGSDNGGSDIPQAPTEEDSAAVAIIDYALAVKRLNVNRACNSLTKGGQERLLRNFGSTATDCRAGLKREYSSVTEAQKRDIAKYIGRGSVISAQIDGQSGSGELEVGTELFDTVRMKVQKVGGQWKVSDPGDETLIPE